MEFNPEQQLLIAVLTLSMTPEEAKQRVRADRPAAALYGNRISQALDGITAGKAGR